MRYITRIMTLAAVCTAIALMAIITPAGTSHEEEPEAMRAAVRMIFPLEGAEDRQTRMCSSV